MRIRRLRRSQRAAVNGLVRSLGRIDIGALLASLLARLRREWHKKGTRG